MAKIDRNKPLSPKRQSKILSQAKDTIKAYKTHWDKLYKGDFCDYRNMAAGRMPDGIQARLNKAKYTGKAMLVPRLVADHVEGKTTSIMNATVNRENPFNFVGQSRGDHINAERATQLVMYDWQFTKFKMEARKAVRDAGIVGTGWMQRRHFIDRRLKSTYGGSRAYTAADFDNVFVGPTFDYIRSEMMYPEPRPSGLDFRKITGIVKVVSVPYSSILKEGLENGLYHKYRQNIKNIKKDDYKLDSEIEYSISQDHAEGETTDIETDFKVLIAEWWTSLLDVFGNNLPVWHVTTVANWEQNAQLLRCEIDPMGNGKHPFYSVTMFDPPEPRLNGAGLPEKLYQIFLETFYKKNQRINFLNSAAKRAGILIGPRSAFPAEFIEANTDMIVYSNDAKQIQHLPTDLGAYTPLLNEEAKLEIDAEKTSKTNPVTSGQSPVRRETATTTATIDQNAKAQTLDPVGMVEQTLICPAAEDAHEHNLILTPDPYIGRVLGNDRIPHFFEFSREDVLGRFDAVCQGSSEIVTKALKLANMNSMIQTYANLPVQLDWNIIAKEHFKLAELPNIEGALISVTIQQENIDRENGALSNGIPWLPLEYEDHQRHIGGHQQHIQLLMQEGMTPDNPGIVAINTHIQMHMQLMAQQQGALAQTGQQASFGSEGDFLNRVGSDNNIRIGQGG